MLSALEGAQPLSPAQRSALGPLLTCLRLCTSTFHALNWIDLPEYFENHIAEWMGFLHRYLR